MSPAVWSVVLQLCQHQLPVQCQIFFCSSTSFNTKGTSLYWKSRKCSLKRKLLINNQFNFPCSVTHLPSRKINKTFGYWLLYLFSEMCMKKFQWFCTFWFGNNLQHMTFLMKNLSIYPGLGPALHYSRVMAVSFHLTNSAFSWSDVEKWFKHLLFSNCSHRSLQFTISIAPKYYRNRGIEKEMYFSHNSFY